VLHSCNRGSTKWVSLLADVIKLYNSTPHSSLPDNRCPDAAYEDKLLLYKIHSKNQAHNVEVSMSQPVHVGDKVRHLLPKATFAKEGTNWSSEVYTVKERVGYQYTLRAVDGQSLPCKYRATELQRIPDVVFKVSHGPMTRARSRSAAITRLTSKEGITRSATQARRLLMLARTRENKQPLGKRVKLRKKAVGKVQRPPRKPWFVSKPQGTHRQSLRGTRKPREWWRV
jgi:hypothetical protein